MVADLETLTITSATADIRKSPTLDCRNIEVRLVGLVGFSIGKGLNRKLMEVLGPKTPIHEIHERR